ncbi:MAG: hypothetical protein LBS97_07400 [Treponema sp.]|jgi:hypothetical protein|nr:hypothetical protein [Treponema sp.]
MKTAIPAAPMKLSPAFCLHNGAVILKQAESVITFGVLDPGDDSLCRSLERAYGQHITGLGLPDDTCAIHFKKITPAEYRRAVSRLYASEGSPPLPPPHDGEEHMKCYVQEKDFEHYVIPLPAGSRFGRKRNSYLKKQLEKQHPCFAESCCYDARYGFFNKKLAVNAVVMDKLSLARYRVRFPGKNLKVRIPRWKWNGKKVDRIIFPQRSIPVPALAAPVIFSALALGFFQPHRQNAAVIPLESGSERAAVQELESSMNPVPVLIPASDPINPEPAGPPKAQPSKKEVKPGIPVSYTKIGEIQQGGIKCVFYRTPDGKIIRSEE